MANFMETPTPVLIMPYMPLGSLFDLNGASPITEEEDISIVSQSLTALDFLHSQGVVHRDLKPENILAESRYPLSIKLADFGLAKDEPDLTTFCGTHGYAAPEIYSRKQATPYTAAVDIWSLGVIGLQFLYGVPKAPVLKRRQKQTDWMLEWCRSIIAYAGQRMLESSSPLLGLIVSGMLHEEATRRLSAGACLTQGYDLCLFYEQGIEKGTATPMQGTLSEPKIDRDNSSTTILLGALWGADEPLNVDAQSRQDHPSTSAFIGFRGNRSPYILDHDAYVDETPGAGRGGPLDPPTVPGPVLGGISVPANNKRQRPGGSGSTTKPTSKARGKRRRSVINEQAKSLSRPNRKERPPSLQNRGSQQFRTTYDSVLGLLADLQIGD